MSLFPRFPGSKKNYNLYDGGDHDVVVEPFAGSGAFSQQMMQRGARQIFLGEADPTVRAVYKVWTTPDLHHDFYLDMQAFQKYLARDPLMAWNCLKSVLNAPEDHATPKLAAASLMLRHLTFGGVVRCSANGDLNVSYCEERLAVVSKWRYQLPSIPKDCFVNVFDSWQDCVSAFSRYMSSRLYKNLTAIALLDPPYYANCSAGIRMTPAYPGHAPHDPQTLGLTIEPLKALLRVPQIKRIVVTNYISGDLYREMNAISKQTRLPMKFTRLKKLDTMHNAHATKTQNIEGMWEFGKVACDQLNLFA